MPKFSINEALRVGWDKTKKHFWFLFSAAIAIFAASFVLGLLSGGEESFDPIYSLLNWIFNIFVQVGFVRILLKILDDKRGSVADFLPTWRMFWNVFFVQILYGLVIFVGLILLVIPGIIWALKYGQSLYLVIDKDMGAINAMKESAAMTSGQKWKLFQFFLASAGVVLLGLLALIVGVFFAFPMVATASVHIYRKLSSSELPVTTPSGAI